MSGQRKLENGTQTLHLSEGDGKILGTTISLGLMALSKKAVSSVGRVLTAMAITLILLVYAMLVAWILLGSSQTQEHLHRSQLC